MDDYREWLIETEDRLRDILKSTICHVTSPEGWRGILAAREIQPNDGRFPLSFDWSRLSYAIKKPAVALFDFERAEPQQMVAHWWKCETIFRHFSPATYVLLLDRARLAVPLITYEEATEEFGNGPWKIPYLEAWSAQPVPTEAITEVIVVYAGRYQRLAPSDARLADAAALVAELWPGVTLPADLTKLSEAELLARRETLKARLPPE